MEQLSKGMFGPTCYYRTAKARFDEELGENYYCSIAGLRHTYIVNSAANLPSNMRPDLPVLFFWGTKDLTLFPGLIKKAHRYIERLEDVPLEGSGHWVMVEAKDVVTSKVLSWLDTLKLDGIPAKL